MPDYYAIESGGGQSSTGYLVANGQVFPAKSGPYGRGDIPQGDYVYGAPEKPTAGKQLNAMSDPNHRSEAKKFHIGKGNPNNSIPDDRYKNDPRTGVCFHFTRKGTEGCIGFQQFEAQQALINDYNAGYNEVHVKYFKSQEDLQQAVLQAQEQQINQDDLIFPQDTTADFDKMEKARKALESGDGAKAACQSGDGARPGQRSKTKKGNRMKGNKTVLNGMQQHETLHLDAPLLAGGQIVQSSQTVFVGNPPLPVSTVGHMTTDGTPIDNGEPSVCVFT